MADFDYVRSYYGVPAELGRRITVDGEPGIIAEDRGHYIGVLFEGCTPADIRNCHPTADVVYLDEIVPVPKPTRSQRRYMRFLEADCGATFGEWLKGRRFRD